MAIKIYGRLSSANVQKVIWFCKEANISFESLIYGGIHGGTKTSKFAKLNPNSKVPVINDDNFFLYESNAILRYLSNNYKFLQNKNHKIQGLIDQWVDWTSFTFGRQCSLLTAHKLSLPLEKRNRSIARNFG